MDPLLTSSLRADLFTRYRIRPLESRFAVRIRAFLAWLWHLIHLIRSEARSRVRLAPSRRWRAWRQGFSSRSFVIYRLDATDSRQYLSDYAETKTHRINAPFNDLFQNKLLASQVMELHGLRHPRVRAFLHAGRVHALNEPRGPDRLEDWLPRVLGESEPLVLKPLRGGNGAGIMFLSRTGADFAINGVATRLVDICELLSALEHYLVTDYVRQADYAARVYARTTNTVRILTLWDWAAGAPFIAAATHRFGTARSFPVDNWHGGWGGLSAKIDLATGVLGPGATLSSDGKLCWHERHPDSEAPIQGVSVPFWPETTAAVLGIAGRLPYAPAVGWDLVITNTGCSCLEGNSPPGTYVWQVHDPLLADPRVRRFYQAHGII